MKRKPSGAENRLLVAGGRTIVVLTMRADFCARCASYADKTIRIWDLTNLAAPPATLPEKHQGSVN